MHKTSMIALIAAALTLSACESTRTEATATEETLCTVWGQSLPTRSRSDTAQTQSEIGQAYADFEAACPDFADLIPA